MGEIVKQERIYSSLLIIFSAPTLSRMHFVLVGKRTIQIVNQIRRIFQTDVQADNHYQRTLRTTLPTLDNMLTISGLCSNDLYLIWIY
jgi:hypothetical protein